ncbi:MAG: ArnT family glycosyltransferase, partial [Candidatus Binatia bacterium]
MNRVNALLPLLATLVAVAVTLPGAAGVPFYNTPEPQEALVVWEMVETGDWVLPRRNGEEIPSKPPLYHWIAATLSLAAGGVSELTTRLPSVLAAAATVGIVFRFGAAEWGVAAAATSALVLASSPEWARWAVVARTDQVFTLLVTLALLCGGRWLREPGSARLVALAAAAGGAMLAKGPAGALLPAIALAVQRRTRHAVGRTPKEGIVLGAAVFLAVAGCWYAAALWQGGPDFFRKQILAENVFRFLPDEGGPSREHSVLFYVPALLVGMMPWSLALPFALYEGVRARRAEGEDFTRQLLVWIAVVFVVCSAASGKRSNYLLPLYPAAALLIGRLLSRLPDAASARTRTLVRAIGIGTAVLLAFAAVVLLAWRLGAEPWAPVLPFLHVRDREIVPLVAGALGPPASWLVVAVALLAVSLVAAVATDRLRAAGALFGGAMLLANLVGSAIVRPVEAGLKT